jgi:hypothetical protein
MVRTTLSDAGIDADQVYDLGVLDARGAELGQHLLARDLFHGGGRNLAPRDARRSPVGEVD